MEEAEAAAKADGLVLVRSRTNGEPRPKTYSRYMSLDQAELLANIKQGSLPGCGARAFERCLAEVVRERAFGGRTLARCRARTIVRGRDAPALPRHTACGAHLGPRPPKQPVWRVRTPPRMGERAPSRRALDHPHQPAARPECPSARPASRPPRLALDGRSAYGRESPACEEPWKSYDARSAVVKVASTVLATNPHLRTCPPFPLIPPIACETYRARSEPHTSSRAAGSSEAALLLLDALESLFGAIDDDKDAARCAHALRLRWCARATRATALAWRPTAARRRRPEAASRWPAAASGAARLAADAAAAPATRAAAALAALAPARARE